MAKSKQVVKAGQSELRVDGDALLRPPPAKLKAVGGSVSDVFNDMLVNMVADTLWRPTGMTKEAWNQRLAAAIAALFAFRPVNEIEGMLGAQAVALHYAAMECLRRAMLPDQPGDAAAKLRRDAANLSRTMVDMTEALERRRGKAPQIVRVERVVVNEGGQAIVGNLTSGIPPTAKGGGS